MATLPKSGNLPQTVFLIVLLVRLHIVCLFVHVWPLVILVMYIERSMRGAKAHMLRWFNKLGWLG
jgi:hypothetical protein